MGLIMAKFKLVMIDSEGITEAVDIDSDETIVNTLYHCVNEYLNELNTDGFLDDSELIASSYELVDSCESTTTSATAYITTTETQYVLVKV